MVECWAKALGGSSPVQSGEHLFSAGLFQGTMITVQGFHWCPEPKSVGLASLTANILCTTHNSGLSQLDSAALQTLNALAEAVRLSDVRAGLKPRKFWTPRPFAQVSALPERSSSSRGLPSCFGPAWSNRQVSTPSASLSRSIISAGSNLRLADHPHTWWM
jgi:hypothetical protein